MVLDIDLNRIHFYKLRSLLIQKEVQQLITANQATMDPRSKKIQDIRFTLWNIRKTDIPQIEFSLLGLIPIEALSQFIPMMRECINVSKRDAHIGKYLVLFDLLLNHPPFNQLLHACLLQFYTSIMQHLVKQRLTGEIEQAKTVRKYWVRRIHPMLYGDLKNAVLRVTGIDVDHILSADAVQHIREYYTNVLRLPQQEIIYYLPQAALIPNLTQYPPAPNHYYHAYSHPILPNPLQFNNMDGKGAMPEFRKNRGEPHCAPLDRFSQGRLVYEQKQGKEKQRERGDLISIVTNIPNDINANTNSLYAQSRPLSDFTTGKRIRYQSQQTNISINDDIRQFEQPRKIRRIQAPSAPAYGPEHATNSKNDEKEFKKKNSIQKIEKVKPSNQQEELVRVKEMLSKINIFNRYECKECGIRMETEEQMNDHKEGHVRQRMEMYQQKDDRRFGRVMATKIAHFKTKDGWVQGRNDQQTDTHWMILDPLVENDNPNIECAFCRDTIKRSFVKDAWRLEDAVCSRIFTGSESTQDENDKEQRDSQQQNEIKNEDKIRQKGVKCCLHIKCAQVLRTDPKTTQSWRMVFH